MTKFTQNTNAVESLAQSKNAVAKFAQNAVENFTQSKNTTLNLAFCLAKKLNFICSKMAIFTQNINAIKKFAQNTNPTASFAQSKNTTLNLAYNFTQNTNAVAGFFQSKNSTQNESIKIKFISVSKINL